MLCVGCGVVSRTLWFLFCIEHLCRASTERTDSPVAGLGRHISEL